ncbi:pollen receptor-like kinase 3 [Diospyros lotus]|uniref:pollen receptor-like kinase 3 n=1 Tax=Diospyros lotus TaxID=55363 RepID=UPI0022514DAC|nr:pollen receptor-like kinase 3 [Diospyros lotus]
MAAAVRCRQYRHLPNFLLIIYYYSLSSLPPLSLSAPDSAEALLKFKQSLSNTKRLDSWVPNTPPCKAKEQWAGLVCNAGVVTGLRLAEMGLSGNIDVDALLQLDTLRTITLANNSFSGPIPPFNRIGPLKALYLSFNSFSGEIPSDFFSKMGSLKKLGLSGNKFSGKIPQSLTQVGTLMELRLEHNEFSGPIPPLEQKSLAKLDLSNNMLEGEIPLIMQRFGPSPFQGNEGLCGKPLDKECDDQLEAPQDESSSSGAGEPSAADDNNHKSSSSLKGWVIIGLIALLVAVTVISRSRQKEDKFDKLQKENLDDQVVQVRVPSSNVRKSMQQQESSVAATARNQLKGAGSTRKAAGTKGGGMGDLVVVNDERGVFGLADLMKAAAEVLGNGGLGSAYKAVMGNGVSVVVKRMRDMNKISKDEFDTEMRRLGGLRHPNILSPLAYHYRKDEKLLVSEYVSKGSLLYLLHGDRGISHAELNWSTRLKIIKGVANGMSFLHSEFASYQVPHGNLKSSNILLDSTYEPLLSDYAFYPLINNTQAVQALFASKSPETILYQQLTPKSDVYCLGIVILEIITGKFPSQYLSNQKGGTDVVQWVRSAVSEKRERELIDPEIASAKNSLPDVEKLLQIAAACTESNIDERIDMNEAIRRIEDIQV